MILLHAAFFRPFEPSAGCPVFSGFMADKEQGIDVVTGIFPAILMENPAAPGQTHGGQTVVLGDHQIISANPVGDGVVHTVSTFVKDQGIGAVPVKFMGGVAKDQAGDMKFLAQADGDVCHGTAVGIDEYSHIRHLFVTV